MKLTNNKLKQIIKEEVQKALKESKCAPGFSKWAKMMCDENSVHHRHMRMAHHNWIRAITNIPDEEVMSGVQTPTRWKAANNLESLAIGLSKIIEAEDCVPCWSKLHKKCMNVFPTYKEVDYHLDVHKKDRPPGSMSRKYKTLIKQVGSRCKE